MPKSKYLQSNFSAGELSPKAFGRVDIARYPNAAKSMVNVISRTLGGVDKRPGTQYINAAKNADKKARLVPYIISRDKSYMLEVGDLYLRVYKPDGTRVASYELAIPYTESQVGELDYCQSEEAMYLFHSSVYPYRLRNFDDDNWNCSQAPFTTLPFAEIGDYPAFALTLSDNTVGTLVTATEKTISASDSTADTVTVTAHGYSVGHPVFYKETTDIGGLYDSSLYFVHTVVDANKIKLTLTPTGTAINITGATGTGKLTDFKTITATTSKKTISASDATANTVTVTGHGLTVGDRRYFKQTTVIGGLTHGSAYYVKKVIDANTLQLSATSGGDVIDITGSTGTGELCTFMFMSSDIGRAVIWNSGVAIVSAVFASDQVAVEIKSVFDATSIPSGEWNLDSSPQATVTPSVKDPVGAAILLTLDADGWRTSDVGKYIRINSGLVKILDYGDALNVSGVIETELSAVVDSPALAWTLNDAVWNAKDGYPRTGTIHEQRLVVSGTTKNPQTVWGSRIGETLDFTLGTNDDESFSFTIAGNDNQVNLVAYLVSDRALLALTYGGEYALYGGTDKAITPTNVQIKIQSPHGTKDDVRPLMVGKETMFVQRAGRKVRALGYDYTNDGYKATDIATLAEHITETGVCCMAFQQEPDPVVWVVLNNGRLVSVTFDRELDVVAWNRHEIDGAVESVATMPSGDSEQVWLIIRREVDGNTVRYIERLQPDWYPIYGTVSPDTIPPSDEPYNWGYQLDCAVSQDSVGGKATWDGLDHLEGLTVRALADGVDMGDFTVTAGEITLPRDANRVLVGLMFSPEIELLRPEIPVNGTSQASAISTNKITVRVDRTIGMTINGTEVIPGRVIGPAQLDTAPEPYTGDKSETNLGWGTGEDNITIGQDVPFPFHLLSVIREVTVNE